MRYLLYFFLLYVFLPLNAFVDLIAITVFFIIFHEPEQYALIFAFFAGLLLDLFQPVKLGLHTMLFTTLGQSLIFLRKFVAKGLIPITATFFIFFIVRTAALAFAVYRNFSFPVFLTTMTGFLPLYLLYHRLMLGSWTKI